MKNTWQRSRFPLTNCVNYLCGKRKHAQACYQSFLKHMRSPFITCQLSLGFMFFFHWWAFFFAPSLCRRKCLYQGQKWSSAISAAGLQVTSQSWEWPSLTPQSLSTWWRFTSWWLLKADCSENGFRQPPTSLMTLCGTRLMSTARKCMACLKPLVSDELHDVRFGFSLLLLLYSASHVAQHFRFLSLLLWL